MANHLVNDEVAPTSARREHAQDLEQERRVARRNPLVASVEAEELTSGMSLSARTSDVSVHGCYLDTLNPFSPGSRIRVHLTKGNETFHSLAVVVYVHEGLGMGVAFREISTSAREMIQRWMAELDGGGSVQTPSNSEQNPISGIPKDRGTTLPIERLIHILVTKGLLTQEELRGIFS
jgi:hypothetical protein